MSKQKFNYSDQKHFVPVDPFTDLIFKGGTKALSLGYIDHAGVIKDRQYPDGSPGRYVEYVRNKDEKGMDKPVRFRFDQSLGRLLARPTDEDMYGRKLYDFLKNHPECEGSPNGLYEDDGRGGRIQVGVTFKEMDEAKDARIALEANKLRVKAELSVLELDEEILEEVGNVIGYYGTPDELMRTRVGEYARRFPNDYLALVNSEDRAYRAVLKKALSKNIFTKKGEMIMWEGTVIGANENDAVSTLHKDQKLLEALQEKMNFNVVETAKKAGRPRKEV